MSRQPYRTNKGDGTMHEAGAAGPASKTGNELASTSAITNWGTVRYNVPHPMMAIRTQTYNSMSPMNYCSFLPYWSQGGGTIDYVSMKASTANSSATMKIGIYSSKDALGGAPYPDTLLGQASITFTGTGTILGQMYNAAGDTAANLAIDANTWYFVGLVWSSSTTTNLWCKPAANMPHLFHDNQNDTYCSITREIGTSNEIANALPASTGTTTSNGSSNLNDITDQTGVIPWINIRTIMTL